MCPFSLKHMNLMAHKSCFWTFFIAWIFLACLSAEVIYFQACCIRFILIYQIFFFIIIIHPHHIFYLFIFSTSCHLFFLITLRIPSFLCLVALSSSSFLTLAEIISKCLQVVRRRRHRISFFFFLFHLFIPIFLSTFDASHQAPRVGVS